VCLAIHLRIILVILCNNNNNNYNYYYNIIELGNIVECYMLSRDVEVSYRIESIFWKSKLKQGKIDRLIRAGTNTGNRQ